MKTIRMLADFDYRPRPQIAIAYRGGVTYERVPEMAAREILAVGAGELLDRARRSNESA